MNEVLSDYYQKLLARYRDLFIFSSAQGILGWDMMTKMPPRGIQLRSQQLALLSGMGHRMATDPAVDQVLTRIEQDFEFDRLDPEQKRNLHLIRKTYDEQVVLPEELVVEIQRQSSLAQDVWKKARAANDWEMFRPELEKNLELAKKSAHILMQVKKTKTPYDALIDIYEPGMTAENISLLFDELRIGLISLLDKIKQSSRKPDAGILETPVPIELQRQISVALANFLQYDTTSPACGGRIDETEHPFTSGYYDDVRITTHYYEDRCASSIFSILHEAGHALYEQNLNPEWIYQPLGTPCSTGIHESQSRLVENMIGRSRQFWTYFLPRLKTITGTGFSDLDLDRFLLAVNEIKPSKIRIEADELTYNLHVIIRFNIERDLFSDKISIKGLPKVWNQSYSDYLGVKIENDSEGVMQDVHWAGANFGYFPCYALGNIYDGQLLARMNLDVPGWSQELEKGNFLPVKEWLGKSVYSRGNLYDPGDLMKQIAGRKLSVKPYLKYLNDKYSKLYNI